MALSAPELLVADHDVSAFFCGNPVPDHWLKNRALSNQTKGFTAVMVVRKRRVDLSDDCAVAVSGKKEIKRQSRRALDPG